MMLQVKALAAAGAALVGGGMFLVALGDLVFPGYGGAMLDMMASVYPGYDGPDGVVSAMVLGLYAALDGAVGGAVVALVYNGVVHLTMPRGERFSA